MGYKENFMDFMVRAGVLTFGDFITKSGRKTPFFINTGNYKTGEQVSALGEFYADCIMENIPDGFDILYGPAYKGIPLAVSTAAALFRKYGVNAGYCFNRKEAKDHGEGGSLIGATPAAGSRVLIIEDVITAGTSVRESIPLLRSAAEVQIAGLIVSVNRMERGQGEKTALAEVEEEFGIKTMSIVSIADIIGHLRGREIDGRVVLDDACVARIQDYLREYGAKQA